MYLKSLSSEISKEVGVTDVLTKKIIGLVEKKMQERLLFGEDVNLNSIGKFYTHVKKKHRKHHLKTGKTQVIPASYKLRFKISTIFNAKIMAKTVYDAEYFANQEES